MDKFEAKYLSRYNRGRMVIEYEDPDVDAVSAENSCPGCGERLTDNLVWRTSTNGEPDEPHVVCFTCGNSYTIEEAHREHAMRLLAGA